jgi:hypothetical protein
VSADILSALEVRPAPQVYPLSRLPVGLVVSRIESNTVHAVCALCWVGPCQLLGEVRERSEPAAAARPICSRCLVTLEMLAVQFGHGLRLQVDTPA